MTRFKIPTTEQEDAAREIFTELQIADELMNRPASGSQSVSASRLYAYASGRVTDDPVLDELLRSNLNIRAAFKRMVDGIARYSMPEAIAASSEEYPTWHTDGCDVRVAPSQVENDRLYLIIEIKDRHATPPGTLVATGEDGIPAPPVELPPLRNNVIQVVVSRESVLGKLLKFHNTQIDLT